MDTHSGSGADLPGPVVSLLLEQVVSQTVSQGVSKPVPQTVGTEDETETDGPKRVRVHVCLRQTQDPVSCPTLTIPDPPFGWG